MAQWIVIANQTETRVLKQMARQSGFKLVKTIKNPLAGLKARELSRHAPAVSMKTNPSGGVRRGVTERTNPREDAVNQYSLTIAKDFRKARLSGDAVSLVIVAEPKFMGKLKAAFDDKTLDLVANWIKKDFGKLSLTELNKVLVPLLD